MSEAIFGPRRKYTDAQVAHVKKFFVRPHHLTKQPMYIHGYGLGSRYGKGGPRAVRVLIGHVRPDGVPRVLNISYHVAVLCEATFDLKRHALATGKQPEATLLEAIVETMNLKLGEERFVAGRMEL